MGKPTVRRLTRVARDVVENTSEDFERDAARLAKRIRRTRRRASRTIWKAAARAVAALREKPKTALVVSVAAGLALTGLMLSVAAKYSGGRPRKG